METRKSITAFPQGRIVVPPSKSASHRSLICAALCGGGVTVENLQLSEDIKVTLGCISSLGGRYTYEDGTLVMINGISSPSEKVQLDCLESGSTLRFFIPIIAALSADAEFIGAKRLFERPLEPYEETLGKNGVSITKTENGIRVNGTLKSGSYSLRGDISSQFITGLLFGLSMLKEQSEIFVTTKLESKGYIDLTLGEQKAFGVDIINNDYQHFIIPKNTTYQPTDRTVEGDFSNGAFMLVAAALGCDVTVAGLNQSSYQGDKAFLDVLEKVGANVLHLGNGDIRITTPMPLLGADIDVSQIPDLAPPIAVLLCFCKGTSRIVGASRLRIKESDRLKTIASELNSLGAKITEYPDNLLIIGVDTLLGGECTAHNDHRIAMMCAVAGIKCKKPVELEGYKSVDKSYPAFWGDFSKVQRED